AEFLGFAADVEELLPGDDSSPPVLSSASSADRVPSAGTWSPSLGASSWCLRSCATIACEIPHADSLYGLPQLEHTSLAGGRPSPSRSRSAASFVAPPRRLIFGMASSSRMTAPHPEHR